MAQSRLLGVSHSILKADEEGESSVGQGSGTCAVLSLAFMPFNNGVSQHELPALQRLDVRMSRGQIDAATAKLQRLADQLGAMQ